MKVKLLAIDSKAGWGFVSYGEKILLLRPPYTKLRLREVSEEMVSIAVLEHGFEDGKGKEFEDLKEK